MITKDEILKALNRDRKGFFSPPSHTTPHTGPYGAIPKGCRAVAGPDLQPQTCTFIRPTTHLF